MQSDVRRNTKLQHFKYILMFLVALSASCASHKKVDARDLIEYESSSSFHHLFYTGSDESYHYVFRRGKVSFKYKIPREQAAFDNEFPYLSESHEPVLLEPGTIEKAIKRKETENGEI